MHTSFLEFRQDEPRKATKVYGTGTLAEKEPGNPTAEMEIYAVCPRRHVIRDVPLSADRVRCEHCRQVFELEDGG